MLACATHTARTRDNGGAPDPDIRLSEGVPSENGGTLSEALRRRELPQFIDCRRAARCSVHSRSAARLSSAAKPTKEAFCQEFIGEKNEKPVPSCKAGRREDNSDVARANFCGGEEQDLLKVLLYASLKSRQTVANEAISRDISILKLIIIKIHSFSLSEKIF